MKCHCCQDKLSQKEADEIREFQSEPICEECVQMREDSNNPANFDYEQFSDADSGL